MIKTRKKCGRRFKGIGKRTSVSEPDDEMLGKRSQIENSSGTQHKTYSHSVHFTFTLTAVAHKTKPERPSIALRSAASRLLTQRVPHDV